MSCVYLASQQWLLLHLLAPGIRSSHIYLLHRHTDSPSIQDLPTRGPLRSGCTPFLLPQRRCMLPDACSQPCAPPAVLQLVFSSSCTVYGIPKSSPITEDTPLGAALNPYGRTKLFQEEMFRWGMLCLLPAGCNRVRAGRVPWTASKAMPRTSTAITHDP
jgi:hypothetical protein